MMKTIGVVMLLFLVFVLSANPLLAAAEAVRDSEGNEVRAGEKYYVLPIIWAFGGGLTTDLHRNLTFCHWDVVQKPFEVELGDPVTFFHEEPNNGGVVQLNTDLSIQMPGKLFCRTPTLMWEIDVFDQILKRYFVTARSVTASPITLRNLFRIKKIENFNQYKFVFCPPRLECSDIGIFTDKFGVRRLSISNDPFEFLFVKAEPLTTSSS